MVDPGVPPSSPVGQPPQGMNGMRMRKLRAALLHGSDRSWREGAVAWPGVVGGTAAVGLVLIVLAVLHSFGVTP